MAFLPLVSDSAGRVLLHVFENVNCTLLVKTINKCFFIYTLFHQHLVPLCKMSISLDRCRYRYIYICHE